MPDLNIHTTIAQLEKSMIGFRRHLHRHPELGFQEVETARYILSQIRDLDRSAEPRPERDEGRSRRSLEIRHPVARTGIVATMRRAMGPASPCGPIWTPCLCRRPATCPTGR